MKESIIGALIGSSAGFIFAIIVFYITEYCRKSILHKRLLKDAKTELELNDANYTNVSHILSTNSSSWTPEQKITLDEYFCLNNNLHTILDSAYKEGCIHQKLKKIEDLNLFFKVLNSLHSGSRYWLNTPHSWISGNITLAEKQRIIPIEKNNIDALITNIKTLTNKLSGN